MLFLASNSPRRKQILTEFNIPFECVENKLTKEPDSKLYESPIDYVQECAKLKAEASFFGCNGIVMGVDTIVYNSSNTIFCKPTSKEHAFEMLSSLVGHSHHVSSACWIINTQDWQGVSCVDTARVSFNAVTGDDIWAYINDHNVLDKAGGYGIQHHPSFFQAIDGDYYTVMGLPMNKLLKIFSDYGIVKQ